MKKFFLLSTITILFFGCTNSQREADFDYIRVFTITNSDSITAFNKGMGLCDYMYYEPKKDLLINRRLVAIEPHQFKTYAGSLNNDLYVDTIQSVLTVLRRHKSGILPDSVQPGSCSIAQTFYIEFADANGVQINRLVFENDTLHQFYSFRNRLNDLPWNKKLVNNDFLNDDSIIVAALVKLGIYAEIETPYIPLSCEAGIDLNKIYGTWRSIGNRYKKSNSYARITIIKGGHYAWARIDEGKLVEQQFSRFSLDPLDNTLTIKTDTVIHKYNILKLTDNCFETKRVDNDEILRLDRLQ